MSSVSSTATLSSVASSLLAGAGGGGGGGGSGGGSGGGGSFGGGSGSGGGGGDGGGGDGGETKRHEQAIVPRMSGSAGISGRGGHGKAPPVRSASSPLMTHDEAFSSSEFGGRRGGRGDRKASGTLRSLLSALLHKSVSERATVREAQEHPWMLRMVPRRGDAGFDERVGARPGPPVPFKQVRMGMYVCVGLGVFSAGVWLQGVDGAKGGVFMLCRPVLVYDHRPSRDTSYW